LCSSTLEAVNSASPGELLVSIYEAILNAARRSGGAVSSPSGVWGGAPAEIEFDAF